jgi:hypothetical protein
MNTQLRESVRFYVGRFGHELPLLALFLMSVFVYGYFAGPAATILPPNPNAC